MEAVKMDIKAVQEVVESMGENSVALNFSINTAAQWDSSVLLTPHRIDSFLIVVCTCGQVTCLIDMQKFVLSKNSFIVFTPSNIIEVLEISEDYRTDIMNISREYLMNSLLDVKSVLPIFQYIMNTSNRQIELAENEINLLHNFFGLINQVNRYRKNLITQSLVMSFFSLVSQFYSARIPDQQLMRTRQEEYFEKFVKSLSVNHRHQRSVQFYADSLHITPKYLSYVIKEITGKTAAEWIDDFVIQEAKVQLRFSTKSIQEISYYLNFSTQSFFGKYFKRHTGMSPSQFRSHC